MNHHEAIPGSQTCTGIDCRTPGGRAHMPHPKFSCTCGVWYATERGLRAHVTGQAAFVPVADAQEMAQRAGLTLTRYCAKSGAPT